MVYATADGAGQMRRLRYGMIGGGRDAFIGAVHRMAARLDDHCELVAGALSADPEKARLSGQDIGLDPARIYGGFEEMAKAEAGRPDGVEAAVIVTPNHLHYPVAKAFLAAGIDVICDKPLSLTMAEAYDLVRRVRESKLVFAVTLNNTGYPMVRQAREMIAAAELGDLRIVHAAYIQDWLTRPIDAEGQKQAEWRTDPARAGLSACLADIGVHAHNLAQFVTGLDVAQVSADLATFVPGRRLDDNAHVMLRYASGARGVLMASQVAPGNLNSLSLKVYGTKAGLEWSGEVPEILRFTPFGEPTRILVRGGPGGTAEARRGSRMPAGHPEGYIEGFANLYRDAASLIRARRAGRPFDPLAAASVPTVIDGAKGIRFVEAAVQSSLADGKWMSAELKGA
jgi:predicted dehydrogenase